MIYKDKELSNMGELFNEELRLAKENKDEAHEFFKEYVKAINDENDDCGSLDEAEIIAKSNLGYYAGYYDEETCNIIYETYQCEHPIFGKEPFNVSPGVAFKKGYEMGTNSK